MVLVQKSGNLHKKGIGKINEIIIFFRCNIQKSNNGELVIL